MPPSQLKQLKASLRDSGILAPQKSKKQRKTTAKDASKRLQRNAALEDIRQRFNPFEVKAPSRVQKFEIASNKPAKPTVERPGVTRGLGEERRRATLLKEIQSRNKVGGMLDRRFGEDDPNMTPEMKAAERFARQATKQGRKNSMFDLEDDEGGQLVLTHGGRALNLAGEDDRLKDDFEDDVSVSDEDNFHDVDDRPRKRLRLDEDDSVEEENGEHNEFPQRKKTKNEVMQEVIAKSKAYKAARQAQKEDDDDLRAELDKGIGDMFAALTKHNPNAKQLPSPPGTDSEPAMDPGRAAMLAGKSREDAEKEYEANIRQLKLEARSKPTTRTKTEEQKAAEEKSRLEDLERKRLRRMKGEAESSEDDDDSEDGGIEIDQDQDDAEVFGLEQPRYIPQLDVEDEDEFVMDNIVASDSDAELASDFEDDESSTLREPIDDGDDDFINGLVLPQPAPSTPIKQIRASSPNPKALPFTFKCPQDVTELMNETKDIASNDLPTAVQRIRALYHKGLAPENEDKLAKFAQALIFWISALVNGLGDQDPPMEVIEQLLRHIHSMAKTQPNAVAAGFREYLRRFLNEERKSLNQGDLIVLTGVSTIFPTSDQWHPVVTPAMLVLARCLGQAPMESLADLAKGAYACSLALRYQIKSERFVPEAITFICKGIELLIPRVQSPSSPKDTPDVHINSLRIANRASTPPATKLSFYNLCILTFSKHEANKHDTPSTVSSFSDEKPKSTVTAESILLNLLNLCIPVIDYYTTSSAFPEFVDPLRTLLATHLSHATTLALLHADTQTAITSLSTSLDLATSISLKNRTPLLLHSHRPLAIKSAYPLFSETYNPERKQRDPDAERAELNKLKAEHKKERKGAMRELRKDANFMAREQLREKKVRDEAYEKKFKRLVAEIQGEEGKEAKEYERQKARRKGGRF